MGFFNDHWQGKFSVSKAGWQSSIVGILLVLPTNYWMIHSFLTLNNLSGFDDLMARGAEGMTSLQSPSKLAMTIDQLIELPVMIWWSIGSWRSCDNPANHPKGNEIYLGFKMTIIFAALIQLYEFYDYVTTIKGG